MPHAGRILLSCTLLIVFLLSYTQHAQARSSKWRTEFIKCSYLSHEHNTSRAIDFCGMTPFFFCCSQDNPLTNSKCCTVDEYLQELSPLLNVAHILSWCTLAILILVALLCAYILLKSKKLLKYSHTAD